MAALDPFDQTDARTEQAGDGRARPLVQPPALEPGLPQAQPPLGVPAASPTAPARPLAPGGVALQPTGARPILVGVAAGTAIRQRDEGRLHEREFTSVALKNSPPWLVSAAFHMLLLIILGLLAMSIQDRSQVNLNFTPVYAEQLGEQLEFDTPFGTDRTDAAEEPIFSISDLPEVPDPFAAPTNLEISPDGPLASSDIEAPSIGLAFTGRQEGASKKMLLGRYGGTALTQAAVRLGLEWLVRNQWRDGSWSLNGPYSGGVPKEFDNPVAATAMALLAFQGDGHTHQKGRFRPNVARGWNWLLREQDANGNFFHEGAFNHHFYTQGLCTIALCELYGMTKDAKYKQPAQKAVQYCLDSQSPEGGWRYAPRSDSDVSVTGWIVMALQSAKMAGLEVPEDHFRRVERFLDKVARDNGSRYPYQRGGEIRLSMTAEALLCRQYLGWDRDDPRLVAGAEWITSPENLVNFNKDRDVYTWYYTTQVAHHMEGDYWKRWNAVMRQALPEQQVQHGRENGSWDPEKPTMDQWAPHGGRLYVTCLSLYMLEVYYRHLPIYSKIYTDLLKSGRAAGR